MKRLARLAFATGLAASLLLGVERGAALATPFSDVPANHWAYQYIQSLAADGIIDGYPDGKFKGDRPLTRYEMAVVVARVIAKLQENQGGKGPSREDLDKLQKLIDSLKDELDALGVRVTNLEDSLDALDKRTKFAQSLALHGAFLPNLSLRQRPGLPESVTNTTGAAVNTYYGATAPAGAPAPGNPTAVTGIDPFVNAYLTSDDSNNPLTQASSQIYIRQDTRFSLSYQINENVQIQLPVHVLNYEYGGEFSNNQQRIDLEPGVDVTIAKAGALSNLDFKFGIIDNMSSSRLGLAFRTPQGYNGQVPYVLPYQPFQKGFAFKGTVGEGAFGSTDFEGSFTRVDNTLLDTQPGNIDPSQYGVTGINGYLLPIVPNQGGFNQAGAAGALTTNTFNSGTGSLAQVYLGAKAVNGSVYVSFYNGATFNANGVQTGGPAVALPAITYNDTYNAVVFGSPLPAGSTVSLTYRGLNETNDTAFERYMIRGRLNQKFKGYAGAEIGVTFNRVFDFDDTITTGSGATGLTAVNHNAADGFGLVSDTVLGIDFQTPLPFNVYGPDSRPVVFGEFADSKFTADYHNVPAVGDTAGIVGVRFKVQKVELSAQYQTVGSNFFSGAPFRFYGNAPPLFASYKGGYYPDFFGFANNVGINQQYDGQFTRVGLGSNVTGNPNLTFAYPAFNPLKATGPQYFSAFAPNSRGESVSANAPVRIGDITFTTRAAYQHLEEIRPNSFATQTFGPQVASNRPLDYDTYSLGTTFALPVFGQNANIGLNGAYETLKRLDATPFQYNPINPATQAADTTAFAAANTAFPTGPFGAGSGVSFYPNYVNMRHITIAANASLPLTKNFNLNGSYSTQRYGGSYGTTLTQNISERKDYYTGGVTYNIPKTNSSLSFLARHYGYADDVVPNFNFSQNRQDVNFTIRF